MPLDTIISFENVPIFQKDNLVLTDVSFHVDKGEFLFIIGKTGTGKTKTLQVIAEQLSEKGVPVILMDLKGDLSGLAQPGEEKEVTFILGWFFPNLNQQEVEKGELLQLKDIKILKKRMNSFRE